MSFAIALLRLVYVFCILTLAVYTCGQLYILVIFVQLSIFGRRRTKQAVSGAARGDGSLQQLQPARYPHVTVQLPMYNERHIARRIIDATAALDYPQERLHIQVLDDSTDDTTDLIRDHVAQLRSKGLHIDLIHRKQRSGYKAGALANGLRHARGELVAIFDADFIPAPDFLHRTVPQFLNDSRIGCVQTRWGHLNDDENLLTRSQALAIDGHFAVEQYARCRADLLFNFNGSCGLWRRVCIEDAGGWQSETLTEDFDLSYRAQIRGWRFVYLRDVMVPGEVPPQIHAYKQQQARWAKGSTQVLLKLFWPLIRSKLNLRQRLMGILQLFQYAIQPIMLAIFILTPIMMVTRSLDDISLTPLGVLGLGIPLLYVLGQKVLYRDWLFRSLYFPALMLFSSGMLVNNSRAAISALLGRPSEFKRTPKFHAMTSALRSDGSPYTRSHKTFHYAAQSGRDVLWEVTFGLYALLAALLAESLAPSLVAYFALYAAAFLGIACIGIADRLSVQHVVAVPHADTEPIGQPGR